MELKRFGGEVITDYPDAKEMMWHIWHDSWAVLKSESEFVSDYGHDPEYKAIADETLANLKAFLGNDLAKEFLDRIPD